MRGYGGQSRKAISCYYFYTGGEYLRVFYEIFDDHLSIFAAVIYGVFPVRKTKTNASKT